MIVAELSHDTTWVIGATKDSIRIAALTICNHAQRDNDVGFMHEKSVIFQKKMPFDRLLRSVHQAPNNLRTSQSSTPGCMVWVNINTALD